jgi:hypothetical protein
MKITLNILLSAIIIIVLTFSCKKEGSNSNSSQSDNYHLTVKKDGVEFNANQSVLVSYSAGVLDYYSIQGLDSDGNHLTLILKSPLATGTFPTGMDLTAPQQVSAEYKESLTSVWNSKYSLTAGSITISQNTSTNMKGTFYFTGVSPSDSTTKVFTEGEFYARKL